MMIAIKSYFIYIYFLLMKPQIGGYSHVELISPDLYSTIKLPL